MKYDNDGDMPGDTGGSLGNKALMSAPSSSVPLVSQAWRGDDPTAWNRDINNGPDLAAVPQPSQTEEMHEAAPSNVTVN